MSKPLRHYIARAVPNGDHYHAEFGMPGGHVDFVYDDDGEVKIYHSSQAADLGALRTLVSALNARSRADVRSYASIDRVETSIKPTAEEFAAELAETGLQPGEWARLWGSKPDNVLAWLSGERDVPFPIRWVLPVLRIPGALATAVRITDDHTVTDEKRAAKRRERRNR